MTDPIDPIAAERLKPHLKEGEELLWAGRPMVLQMFVQRIPVLCLDLLTLGFFSVWCAGALMGAPISGFVVGWEIIKGKLPAFPTIIFLAIPIIFVIVGFFAARYLFRGLRAFAHHASKPWRNVYGLSQNRLIQLNDGNFEDTTHLELEDISFIRFRGLGGARAEFYTSSDRIPWGYAPSIGYGTFIFFATYTGLQSIEQQSFLAPYVAGLFCFIITTYQLSENASGGNAQMHSLKNAARLREVLKQVIDPVVFQKSNHRPA